MLNYSLCHHAPVKIVYMTFRGKMTSSDKRFALHLGTADYLCLNAVATPPKRSCVSDSWSSFWSKSLENSPGVAISTVR